MNCEYFIQIEPSTKCNTIFERIFCVFATIIIIIIAICFVVSTLSKYKTYCAKPFSMLFKMFDNKYITNDGIQTDVKFNENLKMSWTFSRIHLCDHWHEFRCCFCLPTSTVYQACGHTFTISVFFCWNIYEYMMNENRYLWIPPIKLNPSWMTGSWLSWHMYRCKPTTLLHYIYTWYVLFWYCSQMQICNANDGI